MSSKQYTREQIRDMLHQIARGKLAIMNDTDLDIYLQELQQPTATEDKSIEQMAAEIFDEENWSNPLRRQLRDAHIQGYKANTVNIELKQSHSELLEALEKIKIECENTSAEFEQSIDDIQAITEAAIQKAEQLNQ